MSSSLGPDFSDVNVHRNSQSAVDAGALAFTQGNDIHFAPGQYNPSSDSGKELLGHELTHVVQQREERVSANNEVNGMPTHDDKELEAEAVQMKAVEAFSFSKNNRKVTFNENFPSTELAQKSSTMIGTVSSIPLQLRIDLDESKSNIAGKINESGNVVGGIEPGIEKVFKIIEEVKRFKELQAANQAALASLTAALKKVERSKKAVKAAGSGKSAIKSARASKAVKAANEATKTAKKAAQTLANKAKELSSFSKGIKTGSKIFKVLNALPLDEIGAVAFFFSKLYSSQNTTTTGKVVDAGVTAAFDTAFSFQNPITAAIDAVIGLIPGGERINISNTMSNSISSITGAGEAIWTGDMSGLDGFHQKSLAGDNTFYFEKAAEWGESYKEREGVSERVERTGDFWGGSETKAGRAGAFAASIPVLGEIGEGIGQGAGWAVTKGIDLWGEAIEGTKSAKEYIEDNFTLDPTEIEWDPREWF